MGIDPAGNAVFAWQRSDGANERIQARARTAAGALSATQTLSAAGQSAIDPQLAVDPNGNAVFAWVRRDGTTGCGGIGCARIQVRARSAGGVLSAIQTLSAPGQDASEPQVAIDPNGNAVFAWQRQDGTTDCGGFACTRIEARARSAAGSLSVTLVLSSAGQSASEVAIGVDSNGNAVAVWARPDGTTNCGGNACTRIEARARSAAGALGAVQTLSASGQSAEEPEVAVAPGGDAVAVWSRPDGTTGCGGTGCFRIQSRLRSAAGALSAIQTLSAAGQNAHDPQVAVDPGANAVFAWGRDDGTTDCGGFACSRIQARARSAAGVLSAPQTLSAPGQHAIEPQLAVAPSGDAAFGWQRQDGTTACGGFACSRTEARTRSATGALSPTQILSDAGQHSSDPGVAVDAGGAAAVWSRNDGTTGCGGSGCSLVQAAVGP